MGLLKSGAIAIISVLLFFSVFFAGLTLTFSLSLNYNNVQANVGPFVQNLSAGIYPLNQTVLNNFVNETYYKSYNCTPLKCIESNQVTYLYSNQAREFWQGKAHYLIISAVILFLALLLLSEKKSSAFLYGGGLTILASLPFNKSTWVSKLIPAGNFKSLISMFFTNAHDVFLIFFLIGIALVIIGIILVSIRMGLSISKFLDKFKKKKVDSEEIKEKVQEELKKKEEDKSSNEDVELKKSKSNDKKYSLNEVKEIVKEELKLSQKPQDKKKKTTKKKVSKPKKSTNKN